jgi:formylglycine-generating enzyme required for sulfatase activity
MFKSKIKLIQITLITLSITACTVTPAAKKTAQSGVKNKAPQPGEVWTEPVTGMEFVWVPGGSFMMGSPVGEKDRDDDEGPVHQVQLDGFWLGKHEVTRGQFGMFVEATGYKTEADKEGGAWGYKGGKWDYHQGLNWRQAGFAQDDSHPVVCVSWNDARDMAAWLSERGNGKFQLPTEAQWEYACRGGTTTSRFWGENPDEACKYANVADQALQESITDWSHKIHNCNDGYIYTAPAGSFRPNPFGLYDMLGNVWEWCADLYSKDDYSKHQRLTAISMDAGAHRIIRGGGWNSYPRRGRCAHRNNDDASRRHQFLGFRLSRIP